MKKLISLLTSALILFSFLQFPNTAYAVTQPAASGQFSILGSIGGPTSAVAVSGGYAFVGKGSSIIVLGCAGGKLTQRGNQLNLPSFVSDLKVSGSVLYVACGSAGLRIIDIKDPLNPKELGSYATKGFAEAVAVAGSTAYLANGNEGLQVLDVSDPASPKELGQVYKGKYAFTVALGGSKAYIAAADDGLLIADVSSAVAPVEMNACDTPGIARNVIISGNYAFVADDWKGVAVFDISNPTNPALIRSINTAGRAHGIAVDRNYLYVADAYMGLRVFDIAKISSPKDLTSFIPADSQLMRVVVSNGYAYCADRTLGLLCFSIANPSSLRLKGFYSHTTPVPLDPPSDLTADPYGYLYCKDLQRLIALDVLSPYADGTYRPGNEITRAEVATFLCKALRVSVPKPAAKPLFKDVSATNAARSYIEAAVNQGLMKAIKPGYFSPDGKVTNSEAIGLILHILHRDSSSVASYINGGDKQGLLMFANGSVKSNIHRANFLAMLYKMMSQLRDAKTKATILQSKYGILFQAAPCDCMQVAVKGRYAYALSGAGGISVVDVQNPIQPRQVAHLDFPSFISLVRISGNYLYVIALAPQIYTVDITDPLHPVCLNSLDMQPHIGPPRGADIDSDRMYIADEHGFKIISLSNPAKPTLLQHIDKPDSSCCSSDIAVRNGIVYVTYGSSGDTTGIYIYNCSDISNVKLEKRYNPFNCNFNIGFHGNYAYVNMEKYSNILDITDIHNPVFCGKIEDADAQQYGYTLGVVGNIALLPDDTEGVKVVDISDPANPRAVSVADTTGIPLNLQVSGGKAYIADSLGGLRIMELSDAPQPVPDSPTNTSPSPTSTFELKMSVFRGNAAEYYVLTADKAKAAINGERAIFSQTQTVTNANDSGKGSLRWCLQNIQKGGLILFDTRVFNVAKPATIYIQNKFDLPADVTIDASNAGVIIDGSKAPSGTMGIQINGDGAVIKGLKIQNVSGDSITVYGRNNIIGGSRLKGKGPNGEGNVIINSGWIYFSMYEEHNILVGNNIGVDSDGISAKGNIRCGIGIGTGNTIGIDDPAYRNIIGNCELGVGVDFGRGNLIEGNYIGTDITGNKPIPNIESGITIELGSYGNIIQNNIVCNNGRMGINIGDVGSNFNVVIGNSVGIGADGVTQMSNGRDGEIWESGASGIGIAYNVIGGKSDVYQNKVINREYYRPVKISYGTFDSIVDGHVYKYMYMDRY